MERIDLLHNQTIYDNDDSLYDRGTHTHRSLNSHQSSSDLSDYLSVPVHLCSQTKQNVTYHMRYRRYLLMCMVVLAILLLLYIPVYHHIIPTRIGENSNSASLDVVASIPGWSYNTSRELSTYVKPNSTAVHEPSAICTYPSDITNNKPIFLMIVVCSAVKNFEERNTIRATWGNVSNLDYPGYVKKVIASKLHSLNVTTITSDINASDSNPISNRNWNSIYRYYTNIYHKNRDINKKDLKDDLLGDSDDSKGTSLKNACDDININVDVNVKVLFLLGLPHIDNDTDIELQHQVDLESEQYQDIIQENFIDSYNNLTLKSVMMLKWVASHCSHTVRYLMKADDDMFVNINKLVYKLKCLNLKHANDANLANRSNHNSQVINASKNLLLGSLIKGARPIADTTNKWYSPQYMYSGKVYPPYLSGTGYVMSISTVNILYRTALVTPIFHLEDIYITGICAYKAKVKPQHSPLFSYQKRPFEYCEYSNHITSHQLTPSELYKVQELFSNHTEGENEKCEKKKPTKVT